MNRREIKAIEALAMSPANFPDHPTRSGRRVVLIGANIKDDYFVLSALCDRLVLVRSELATALSDNRHWDVYDMSTKPDKGDALDHLGEDVQLVVTCHVPMHATTPTDKTTIRRLKQYPHLQPAYFYNRRNNELLPWCMIHRVPLLAFGDQPNIAEGLVRQTLLFEQPEAILYERW